MKAPDGSTKHVTQKSAVKIQVLKTEQSANEKVSLINETSNHLFVWNIINICAVTIISTSGALDSTFLYQKVYKRYKRRSLCVV
jgi:hypothetical protein